jgi:hypothetical protein
MNAEKTTRALPAEGRQPKADLSRRAAEGRGVTPMNAEKTTRVLLAEGRQPKAEGFL